MLTTYLVRRITGFSVASGRFDRQILVDLLRFGGRNTVIAISGMVSYSLDALIIGIILPVAQVAPYDIALSTANLTRNLTTYGSDLLLPTYTHFESMKDPHRQARLFSRTVMATLAISLPILVALAAFGDPILKLWLGKVPPKTYSIMIALGFVTALELPGHQCFIFLTGIGRNQLMMRMAVLGATVNLIGSIIATFWLGPIGPAIGSLPAVLVIDFTILPIIVCRYLDVPFRRYAKDALVPVLPAVAVAGAVGPVDPLAVPRPPHRRIDVPGRGAGRHQCAGRGARRRGRSCSPSPCGSSPRCAIRCWPVCAGAGRRTPTATIAEMPAHRMHPSRSVDATRTEQRPAPAPFPLIMSVPHSGSHATPTWFGPEDRPLFGWVHVPDVPGGQGVVLCPSIGLEGEASQLAYRALAVALADAGCTVLRFDYDGIGDSAGRMTDPGRLAEWITSIAAASTTCGRRGHPAPPGRRPPGRHAGGPAAAGRRDVGVTRPVVPVDQREPVPALPAGPAPAVRGRGRPRTPADGSAEIPGFVLDPDLVRDLSALDSTAPDDTYPKSVLVIDAADPDTGRAGARRVRAARGANGDRVPGWTRCSAWS